MNDAAQTIVTIHGFGFDPRIWFPVELAFESHRVIHLVLPGFDGSPVNEFYTIEGLAKLFWNDLDQQGTSSVHLVGHSMGGYVCAEMCAQQPERIQSLSLVHSHVFADPMKRRRRDPKPWRIFKKMATFLFMKN